MEEIMPQFGFSYYDLLKANRWEKAEENCIKWEKIFIEIFDRKSYAKFLTIEWKELTGISGCGKSITYSLDENSLLFFNYPKGMHFFNWLIERINIKDKEVYPEEPFPVYRTLISPQDIINYLKSNDWQDKTRQE